MQEGIINRGGIIKEGLEKAETDEDKSTTHGTVVIH